jgi:hypothetical protein
VLAVPGGSGGVCEVDNGHTCLPEIPLPDGAVGSLRIINQRRRKTQS